MTDPTVGDGGKPGSDPTTVAAKLPVRLVITTSLRRPAQMPLIDWLHRRAEYRTSVRNAGGAAGGRAGFSDAVIIAVVAQSLLPGLFTLLTSWVDQQRNDTSIRIRVGDSDLELQVTGRTDPMRLVAEVAESMSRWNQGAARSGDGPDAAGSDDEPGSG